jgi:uncharacterized membrane protein
MIEIIPNWHPIFVHFTVALFSIAILFYLLAIVIPVGKSLKTNWHRFARWCLWIGMSITFITVAAGYQAYNTVAHDTPSHLAMTEHSYWAYATASLFVILTIWSIWLHINNRLPAMLFLVLALIGGGLLSATAWKGGEAVYRYGLGVMSLPTVAKDSDGGHGSHSHGEESESQSPHPDNAPTYIQSAPTSENSQPATAVKKSKSATEAHDTTPHAH